MVPFHRYNSGAHKKRQSNSTLSDFVIKESEHGCEPSQGPHWTLFQPSKSLKMPCRRTIKRCYHFRLNTSSCLPLLSPNSEMGCRTLLWGVKKQLSLWDITKLKPKIYGCLSYSSHLHRQRASTFTENTDMTLYPWCHFLNLHTFCYWR